MSSYQEFLLKDKQVRLDLIRALETRVTNKCNELNPPFSLLSYGSVNYGFNENNYGNLDDLDCLAIMNANNAHDLINWVKSIFEPFSLLDYKLQECVDFFAEGKVNSARIGGETKEGIKFSIYFYDQQSLNKIYIPKLAKQNVAETVPNQPAYREKAYDVLRIDGQCLKQVPRSEEIVDGYLASYKGFSFLDENLPVVGVLADKFLLSKTIYDHKGNAERFKNQIFKSLIRSAIYHNSEISNQEILNLFCRRPRFSQEYQQQLLTKIQQERDLLDQQTSNYRMRFLSKKINYLLSGLTNQLQSFNLEDNMQNILTKNLQEKNNIENDYFLTEVFEPLVINYYQLLANGNNQEKLNSLFRLINNRNETDKKTTFSDDELFFAQNFVNLLSVVVKNDDDYAQQFESDFYNFRLKLFNKLLGERSDEDVIYHKKEEIIEVDLNHLNVHDLLKKPEPLFLGNQDPKPFLLVRASAINELDSIRQFIVDAGLPIDSEFSVNKFEDLAKRIYGVSEYDQNSYLWLMLSRALFPENYDKAHVFYFNQEIFSEKSYGSLFELKIALRNFLGIQEYDAKLNGQTYRTSLHHIHVPDSVFLRSEFNTLQHYLAN